MTLVTGTDFFKGDILTLFFPWPCRVETPQKFHGAVHARDYRRAACTSYGLGGTTTELNINMLADKNTDAYCGVFINEVRASLGQTV